MSLIVNENCSSSSSPSLALPWDIFKEIIETIGTVHAERGGILAGTENSNEIHHYQFDKSSRNSSVTYTPDTHTLNKLLKDNWNPQGIRLRGFIHSHPGTMGRPSYGDEIYAARIFSAIKDLDSFWLPIVNTIPDTGKFRLTPWIAYPQRRGVCIVRAKVRITDIPGTGPLKVSDLISVDCAGLENAVDQIVLDPNTQVKTSSSTLVRPKSKPPINPIVNPRDGSMQAPETTSHFNTSNTFDRVRKAYSLPVLRQSRIIAVGAGGAAEWIEQLARCGVGQFILIDPDRVSETNLATQQTYRRDIGRPKVDCIAERIRDINPNAKVLSLHKSLNDFTDEEILKLSKKPVDGRFVRRTVLCGLTDSFFAQARVNRLALKLGIPSLNAQVYKEGRGAEITFTYPGITPACHRCITSSRYEYYIEKGLSNDVTSDGTPIFSTSRLNSLKGMVLLAILHHKTNHPRWGEMLQRIGNRNLIQIRIDPDFSTTLGLSVFDRAFEHADHDRLFFDEVVWLPQEQECPETGYPPCPDCGGTGNLTDAIGTTGDTRLIPGKHSVNTYA